MMASDILRALQTLVMFKGPLEEEVEVLEAAVLMLDDLPIREALQQDEEGWYLLIKYVFERRFGWSESSDGPGLPSNERTKKQPPAPAYDLDSRAKKRVNEALDQVLLKLKQEPMNPCILTAFAQTVPASNKPVVRQQSFLHVYEWVKKQGAADEQFERNLKGAMEMLLRVIILSLCDVWSATRKASAEKLSAVAKLMSLPQLESLFDHILEAYGHETADNSQKDAWRQKEGFLLGLTTLIKQFTYERETDTTGDALTGKACVKFHNHTFSCLPVFITGRLKPLLFRALAHQQLSVRENAAKCFSAFLSRSDIEETKLCLEDTVRKLMNSNSQADSNLKELLDGSSQSPAAMEEEPEPDQQAKRRYGKALSVPDISADWHPHARKLFGGWKSLRVMQEEGGTLVEAFEAQGLISLCEDLLERLPSNLILEQWETLLPTCNLYLAHSASTVRQSCSSLFLRFMAKTDVGSTLLQRNVLQGLSFSMEPFGDSPLETSISPAPSGTPDGSESKVRRGSGSHGWEWREGRLLAYELILGHLVQDHTVKLFTFDPSKALPSPAKGSPSYFGSSFDGKKGGHFLPSTPGAAQIPPTPPPATKADQVSLGGSGNSLSPAQTSPGLSEAGMGIPNSADGRPRRISPSNLTSMQTTSQSSLLDAFKSLDSNSNSPSKVHLENITVEPLRAVLERIFNEVCMCIQDGRWELRRMGLQVLPLLGVTTLWYQRELLVEMWKRWLPMDSVNGSKPDTSLAYVGILLLKEVVKKSQEYRHVVSSHHAINVPGETCRRATETAAWVEDQLPEFLPAVDRMLAHRHPFRVGAVAIQLLMSIHCRSPSVAAPRQQDEVSCVTRWMSLLHSAAHVVDGKDVTPTKRVSSRDDGTPVANRLSAPPTPEIAGDPTASPGLGKQAGRQTQRAAENIERSLLKDICPMLPDFVASCTFPQMISLGPVLVEYIENYHEDLDTELLLVESVYRIVNLPLSCWLQTIRSIESRQNAAEGGTSDIPSAEELFKPGQTHQSCCSFGKKSVRFSYSRPWFPSNTEDAPSKVVIGSREYTALASQAVENLCAAIVDGLCAIVELQSTEVVLLRALLAVLLAACQLVGDNRFVVRICKALSMRLKSHQKYSASPFQQSELRQLSILSNDIVSEEAGSTGNISSPLQSSSPGAPLKAAFFSQSFSNRPKGRAGELPNLTVETEAPANGDVSLDGSMEDDDSDWDDWDEEDDVEAVEEEVGAFLQALRRSCSDRAGKSAYPATFRALLNAQANDSRGWDDVISTLDGPVRKMVQHLS